MKYIINRTSLIKTHSLTNTVRKEKDLLTNNSKHASYIMLMNGDVLIMQTNPKNQLGYSQKLLKPNQYTLL